jgi:hypothetical protein
VPETGVVTESAATVLELVRAIGEEVASFRARALRSESRVRDLEAAGADDALALRQRVAELERENAALQSRLAEASTRTEALLDRVRFTRQQEEAGEAR